MNNITINTIRDEVKNIIVDILGTDEKVDSNTSIASLQLSSFNFIQLIVSLEEKFHIEFPMEDLLEDKFKNIQEIENRVYQLVNIM